MDFKARLARLEERRGETSDEWMSKFYKESGADANEELLRLTEVLADSDANMTEEVIDLVGGLENYKPYESIGDIPFFFTGMESISDTVVKIFDRIIAFIKKWIKVLADAEFKLSLHTALHSHSLENIRTNMRASSRKPKGSEAFTVFTRIPNLSVNYRPVNNSMNLLNALTVLKAVSEVYFDGHSEHVLAQVTKVVTGVTEQKPSDYLADLMAPANPMNIANNAVFRTQEQHVESPHLLGNHRFVITNDNGASSSSTERAQGIRVKLVPSQLTPVEAPAHVNFQYFDNNMMEALLIKCEGILKVLADSNDGPHRHARRQALAALLAAVERVNDDVQRNGIRDEEEARKVVAVLESYIAWIADPYTSFYAYVLRDVRAALNVCEANIA
jgi:hypothetical protein